MKKLKLAVILSTFVLVAGCSGRTTGQANTTKPETESNTEETTNNTESSLPEELSGLTKDENPDIVVTAAVLERMAILPGSTFRVSITVENKGEKAVTYSKGSGSYSIPAALLVQAEGLQPILPQDRLGAATADYQTGRLEPGDTLRFEYFIRAIEPAADFDQYTIDLYLDNQKYIADVSWEDLQKDHPDLAAAAPGSYEVRAFFMYHMSDDAFAEATGFAEGTFSVSVTK